MIFRLAERPDRKEGELSREETVLAKKIFVAFGFLALALVIAAFDSFVPVLYVVVSVIAAGVILIVRSEFVTSRNKIS